MNACAMRPRITWLQAHLSVPVATASALSTRPELPKKRRAAGQAGLREWVAWLSGWQRIAPLIISPDPQYFLVTRAANGGPRRLCAYPSQI